jgi:hypothetical protein
VSSIICYCLASVMMTMVNKVQYDYLSFADFINNQFLVCGVRPGLFHELPSVVHSIHRLLCLCGHRQKAQVDIVQRFWCTGRKDVVSHQFLAC